MYFAYCNSPKVTPPTIHLFVYLFYDVLYSDWLFLHGRPLSLILLVYVIPTEKQVCTAATLDSDHTILCLKSIFLCFLFYSENEKKMAMAMAMAVRRLYVTM